MSSVHPLPFIGGMYRGSMSKLMIVFMSYTIGVLNDHTI
nr:MAG TPA: hypothetical protein [Caudoviricetes sp.]